MISLYFQDVNELITPKRTFLGIVCTYFVMSSHRDIFGNFKQKERLINQSTQPICLDLQHFSNNVFWIRFRALDHMDYIILWNSFCEFVVYYFWYTQQVDKVTQIVLCWICLSESFKRTHTNTHIHMLIYYSFHELLFYI